MVVSSAPTRQARASTNMLPSLVRPSTPPHTSQPPSPTSIFAANAANLFLDEERCSHGHGGATIVYDAGPLGDVRLRLPATSEGEEQGLYAHFVWNAAVLLAELIGGRGRLREAAAMARQREALPNPPTVADDVALEIEFWARRWDVAGESVVELGAGTALPSVVAARAGAARVVATDYPSPELLRAIEANVAANVPAADLPRVQVKAHAWGNTDDAGFARASGGAFMRVLLADVLWLAAQHAALRRSVRHFLAPGGRAWLVAGFHTGRATVADFLGGCGDDGLCTEGVWEVDVNGRVRRWEAVRKGEGVGEARRWCLVAVLKRTDEAHEQQQRASAEAAPN